MYKDKAKECFKSEGRWLWFSSKNGLNTKGKSGQDMHKIIKIGNMSIDSLIDTSSIFNPNSWACIQESWITKVKWSKNIIVQIWEK